MTGRRRGVFALAMTLLLEIALGEAVMVKLFLPDWAILAGGVVVAAAAFLTSARITHWAMSPRNTVVVVRPGPTVFVTKPAGHGHLHERALPIPPPGGFTQGGGVLASPQADAAGGRQRGQLASPSPAPPSPSPSSPSPSPSALPTTPAPSTSASQTPTPPPSPSASAPGGVTNWTLAPSSAPAS